MSLMDGFLTEYVNEIQPLYDGRLGEVQREAMALGMPVIPPETARFLGVMLSIVRPESALEIGCAVGFSSGLICKYLRDGGHIDTIDRYPLMIEKAKQNIEYMGLAHKITIHEGDAAEILPRLNNQYDFIFLDAAKGQYEKFLPDCIRLLKREGVFIADDVLQSGDVAKDRFSIKRRQRTIHKRLRGFLQKISNANGLESSIVPIGDGIVICKKLSDIVTFKEVSVND